ncbi:hypothetical protein SDC9_61177 [bioreactor metagenome]|uniref:Uncharacterized protein n=1 Tax=bioreactor metagenome TaxID=1076179 RepID=A0A644XKQ5_9ZZZZ
MPRYQRAHVGIDQRRHRLRIAGHTNDQPGYKIIFYDHTQQKSGNILVYRRGNLIAGQEYIDGAFCGKTGQDRFKLQCHV